MKSDSLYLMDQKQYNFIEAKKRGKGKQNSKKVGKKALFRFYWHLLSSCSRFLSLCSSEVSPLCPIHFNHPSFRLPILSVCSIFQLCLCIGFFLYLFESLKENVCLTSTSTTATTTIVSHLKLFLLFLR